MIEANNQARNWAVACHLSALVLLLGIPFGNVLGPLVVWLLKKNDYPFVDQHGKEALNFQASITLYWMVLGVLAFLMLMISPFSWPWHHNAFDFWMPMGVAMFFPMGLLMVLLGLVDILLVVMAAVKASDGQAYRYPFSIRFI
ncbi:MAG: DUF4870 domain-containing protein [Methanosarcinales archaeon]|nr:DUF4870 domain-containing protein [Methanosarcinales archaeon]